jgi:hypothetical protein
MEQFLLSLVDAYLFAHILSPSGPGTILPPRGGGGGGGVFSKGLHLLFSYSILQIPGFINGDVFIVRVAQRHNKVYVFVPFGGTALCDPYFYVRNVQGHEIYGY